MHFERPMRKAGQMIGHKVQKQHPFSHHYNHPEILSAMPDGPSGLVLQVIPATMFFLVLSAFAYVSIMLHALIPAIAFTAGALFFGFALCRVILVLLFWTAMKFQLFMASRNVS
jgi:hypothetical protein